MKDERRKPQAFIRKSYQRSDDWAVSKIRHFLQQKGYAVRKKDAEDFDIDITAEKEGRVEYFEVETKTGYPFTCPEDFRFDTVSFLARKKKWASPGFWYIIVCRETLAFLMCHSHEIFKDEHREILAIDSAERKGSDEFYRVPKQKCQWYKLEDDQQNLQ